MAPTGLTDAEAQALVAMEKVQADDTVRQYPYSGAITVPLVSLDGRESFRLDIRRARVDLAKGTYQNRSRDVFILLRLDFGSRPHWNPDGQEVSCPHLHVYRDGYGDQWAVPLPADAFPDPGDLWRLLEDFYRYCNIVKPPLVQKGLFV
jgi:hypothetical protein